MTPAAQNLLMFQAVIPLWDVSLESIDNSPLAAAMEPLDVNKRTESNVTMRSADGSYLDNCSVQSWLINSSDQDSAVANYTKFVQGFTWVHAPGYRVIALASEG